MNKIYVLLITILFANTSLFAQKSAACFTDTSNKKIVYPLIKCMPTSINLDNCSPITFDSAVWRIYYSLNTNCTGYSQSYDINYSGANSKNSISIPVSQNGSYAVTLYLYNAAIPNVILDSIHQCVFVLSNPIVTTLVERACVGSTYIFGGKPYTSSGNYVDTLTSIEGCDSIINLNLNFYNPPTKNTISVTRCAGTPYYFNGQNLTATGLYYDTLVSFGKCDSIIELKLNVISSIPPVYYSNSLCYGQSLLFFGDTLTTTGTYFDTLPSYQGCDSVIAMNLFVYPQVQQGNLFDTICFNAGYLFNGNVISQAGDYTDTLQSQISGCDSIVNLHLFIRPATTFIDFYDTTCLNVPYQFNGSTFTSAGNYGFSLFNQFGCDSSLMLHLHVIDLNAKISKKGDTLTTAGIGAIQWIDCATNQPIAGAVNSIFVPMATGTYAAQITGKNCIELTDCIGDTLKDGVENINLLSNISIYPNPVLDALTIKHLNQIKSIIITNLLGATCLVNTNNLATKQTTLDVSKLHSGTYICKIIDDHDNITYHKFSKK